MPTSNLSINVFKKDQYTDQMVSRDKISGYVEQQYDSLKDGDTLILSVQRDCVFVSLKVEGHEHEVPVARLTNYGYGSSKSCTKDLMFAVMNVSADMPGYVYEALIGDIKAMRQTASWRKKDIKKRLRTLDKKYKKLRRALESELNDIEDLLELNDEDFEETSMAITIAIEKTAE